MGWGRGGAERSGTRGVKDRSQSSSRTCSSATDSCLPSLGEGEVRRARGGGLSSSTQGNTQRFTTAPLHLADTQPSSGTDGETEGRREEGKQVDKREKEMPERKDKTARRTERKEGRGMRGRMERVEQTDRSERDLFYLHVQGLPGGSGSARRARSTKDNT